MPNNVDDLRKHLFETLAALKDTDHPMDLDRARAVADVAKVLVASAKVEVDFLKVTGAVRSTGFLPEDAARRPARPQLPGGTPAAAREASTPAGDRCVLCGCRLTTAYLIALGLCGSCSDRPEAQNFKSVRKPA
jgi:hypothetical protein